MIRDYQGKCDCWERSIETSVEICLICMDMVFRFFLELLSQLSLFDTVDTALPACENPVWEGVSRPISDADLSF
jgi:hypothetical protein